MLTVTGQLHLPQLSPGARVGLAVATRQVPVDCRQKFGFNRSHGTEMAIFAFKQTETFYRNQDTPVHMCVLDVKRHLIELIIGRWQRNS